MAFEPELTGLANALLKSAVAAVIKVVDLILSGSDVEAAKDLSRIRESRVKKMRG